MKKEERGWKTKGGNGKGWKGQRKESGGKGVERKRTGREEGMKGKRREESGRERGREDREWGEEELIVQGKNRKKSKFDQFMNPGDCCIYPPLRHRDQICWKWVNLLWTFTAWSVYILSILRVENCQTITIMTTPWNLGLPYLPPPLPTGPHFLCKSRPMTNFTFINIQYIVARATKPAENWNTVFLLILKTFGLPYPSLHQSWPDMARERIHSVIYHANFLTNQCILLPQSGENRKFDQILNMAGSCTHPVDRSRKIMACRSRPIGYASMTNFVWSWRAKNKFDHIFNFNILWCRHLAL